MRILILLEHVVIHVMYYIEKENSTYLNIKRDGLTSNCLDKNLKNDMVELLIEKSNTRVSGQ